MSGARGPFERCPACRKKGIYTWSPPFSGARRYRCRYCRYYASAEAYAYDQAAPTGAAEGGQGS